MTAEKPARIDKTTAVSFGILLTLLTATAGGSLYLSNFNASIQSMDRSLGEVKRALDRNTNQIIQDGKSQAVLDARVRDLERRIQQLEANRK